MNRRNAITLLAASAYSACANAQNSSNEGVTPWPRRAVRIVVGFPAGSSPDLTARTLAEPLAALLGQPVVVENKPGAGGNIGADVVAKARDDHTLGLMINGNLTTARVLNPKLPFDPARDLQPVSLIGVSPLVLTASAAVPVADARAVIAAGVAAGDRWNYGSPGVGTMGHIGMEQFKHLTGVRAVHVPYPGYAQVAQAMVAGQVHLATLPPALALAQARAGKLHTLGVTSSGRSVLAPEVPPLTEAGVRGLDLEVWNALAAPSSMPAAAVARLAQAVSTVVRHATVRQALFMQGWQVVGSSPEGLAQRIRAERVAQGELLRTLGLGHQKQTPV